MIPIEDLTNVTLAIEDTDEDDQADEDDEDDEDWPGSHCHIFFICQAVIAISFFIGQVVIVMSFFFNWPSCHCHILRYIMQCCSAPKFDTFHPPLEFPNSRKTMINEK